MSARTLVRSILAGHSGFTTLVPMTRVLFSSSLVEGMAPPRRPFVVVTLSTDQPYAGVAERMAPNYSEPHTQYVQVWAHNEPGDMELVDDVIAQVKNAFGNALPQAAENFLQALFLNDSEDQTDPELGTVMRFTRWQFAFSR